MLRNAVLTLILLGMAIMVSNLSDLTLVTIASPRNHTSQRI